jgi:hypothetical protein
MHPKMLAAQAASQAAYRPPSLNPTTAVKSSGEDELIIEVMSASSNASIVLRPHEVSRLRSRYGRGPAFEKWVVDRIRDQMVSFGGG